MDILEAIQKDNLVEFDKIVSGDFDLSTSYGRFPILSICYLYSSKKIIKKYESTMLQIEKYSFKEEYPNVYADFRKKAKRALRLYAGKNIVVSPLEMLLILKEYDKLNELYAFAYKTELIKENLKLIEKIDTSLELVPTETNIQIPYHGLSKKAKKQLYAITAILVITILVSTFCAAWFYLSGIGTDKSPLKVYTEAQLLSYFTNNVKAVKLEKDLTLTAFSMEELKTNIDGNNHTITLIDQKSSMIQSNNAEIKNLNIKVELNAIEIEENYAFLCKENNGTLQNININSQFNFSAKEKKGAEGENLYIAMYAAENKGIISNCSVSSNIKGMGNGNVNASISYICGINRKIVENCIVDKNSTIEVENVDVGGIVSLNDDNATVSSCSVSGIITHNGKGENWNPNVGGIAIENCGKIEHCKVDASLNCNSNAAIINENNNVSVIYLAGIVAINDYGEVNKCICKSQMSVDANLNIVNAGGITAINYIVSSDKYGTIQECGNASEILVTCSNKESQIRVGGIAGCNYGIVFSSYSIGDAKINVEDSSNSYIGAIAGIISKSIYDAYFYFGEKYLYDNIYLITDGFYKSTGNIVSDIAFSGDAFSSIEEIREQKGYWDE